MKKFFFCVSLVLTGLMTSCVEKYEEVDAASKPTWLGGSIYSELKSPTQTRLTGTFNTYLRLVDDLGYAEVLNRTGSKTVFPANDEAFERFFKSNDWGVSSYEQLTDAQKKLLLYSSMLDNAMLVGMLPNASSGSSDVLKGQAVKHPTTVSPIDSVMFLQGVEQLPKGNPYWTPYVEKGIHVVSDGTRPMMVHLTREYMLNNDITTLGTSSDFAILTGTEFVEGTAYIFNDRVISSDNTCQNGYIHQMEDVLLPPGNLAQVARRNDKISLFSRMLDYFSAPYYDADLTRQYNDWAMANGKQQIDSIYQWRYVSSRSQNGTSLYSDPNNLTVERSRTLNFDPGWNQYYPRPAREDASVDYVTMDMAAMFAPVNEAFEKYFTTVDGGGSYLMDIYAKKPNTPENLAENLDSLYAQNPQVLAAFVKNLSKATFVGTVPSKFGMVTNDASENMGLNVDQIVKNDNGKYDITIANNGVLYVLNTLHAPDEYRAVHAPASVYPDMKVMNWLVQDETPKSGVANDFNLGVDFKYYLLAMSSNYAFFIPDDEAFSLYYLDPTSLGHRVSGKAAPKVLQLYYDATSRTEPKLKCNRFRIDLTTGVVDEATKEEVPISSIKSQLIDILNYHTVVLNAGETLGDGGRHYYQTKHGGTIYVEGGDLGQHIMGGAQVDNPDVFQAPKIDQIHLQKNGRSYRLDYVIQPPYQSVYGLLNSNSQFSEFLKVCNGFANTKLLTWAGISADISADTGRSPQDAFTIFTADYKIGKDEKNWRKQSCQDYNVKMFNTYNYTLFAPDNTAMDAAYAAGLPRWTDVTDLFDKYKTLPTKHDVTQGERYTIALAYSKIKALRDFVRYHFMTNAVYVDRQFSKTDYQSLSSDSVGVAKEITLSVNGTQMSIFDKVSGRTVPVTIDASDKTKIVNKMTRDYWFDDNRTKATKIETSSFCAVHQITEPLCGEKSGRYDGAWATKAAQKRFRKTYARLKANNEL